MYRQVPLTVLLDRIESKAFHLINFPLLTDCLRSLSHLWRAASLVVFYYPANCMPPLLLRPRCTRLSSFFHPYSVQLSNARVNQYSQSFTPFSAKPWNFLPVSVFPTSYGLT
ncbi:hypothetical protein E2C01_039234 [Portunus trituberculatus]|uniref:Uncharacterized protein n=1 Tax=Portunus trituberculatus TaxID=210409 RepID=A0A5B7FGB7_PORTR|nr:hypothetical protein [Portunus trituberculatus]